MQGIIIALALTLYISLLRYNGEIKNSHPDGYGIMSYFDGDMCKGDFKQGLPHGRGTFWSSGSTPYKYRGDFVNGSFEGQGSCRCSVSLRQDPIAHIASHSIDVSDDLITLQMGK